MSVRRRDDGCCWNYAPGPQEEFADCFGDGHYQCDECKHHIPPEGTEYVQYGTVVGYNGSSLKFQYGNHKKLWVNKSEIAPNSPIQYDKAITLQMGTLILTGKNAKFEVEK